MANLAYQVTNFAYQGAGQFAYQGSVDAPVADVAATPGRVRRDEDEDRARRNAALSIRLYEERLRAPAQDRALVPEPAVPELPDATASYQRQSARLGSAISRLRSEAAGLLARIAEIEARQAQERIALAERQRLEHQLTLAHQALTLATVQETVLLEEMEVIDVAYFALMALMVRQ